MFFVFVFFFFCVCDDSFICSLGSAMFCSILSFLIRTAIYVLYFVCIYDTIALYTLICLYLHYNEEA